MFSILCSYHSIYYISDFKLFICDVVVLSTLLSTLEMINVFISLRICNYWLFFIYFFSYSFFPSLRLVYCCLIYDYAKNTIGDYVHECDIFRRYNFFFVFNNFYFSRDLNNGIENQGLAYFWCVIKFTVIEVTFLFEIFVEMLDVLLIRLFVLLSTSSIVYSETSKYRTLSVA